MRAVAALGLLVLATAACGVTLPGDVSGGPVDSALGDDTITVASFAFPESTVLAEVYGQALRHEGYDVDIAAEVGARELVQPALAGGLVELVPEYAGTALEFLSVGAQRPSADIAATRAALDDLLAGGPVVPLRSAPGQDTNVVVVTADTARRYDLAAISDLAPVAGGLTFGGPPECPERPFCQPGL
ncbi:MAG TPA: glycine betaine ABC transporter substrate-binding protein, partial [Acidimicrobiales bacterium]|nr:glycine betaine ABC transporter substrate-binding protein [Acidimicrobiales bacterium]